MTSWVKLKTPRDKALFFAGQSFGAALIISIVIFTKADLYLHPVAIIADLIVVFGFFFYYRQFKKLDK